ncbi:metal dependent phosphohydrolase [Striga asiatica]|uniref:Metal dependent phosphohydrolase n=1 Tax=Striga asiatica TaxID=4170 RepID=A0A5A7PF81_STRAF|nr:metal dependent phosphohydrolase [Striga asiatica]
MVKAMKMKKTPAARKNPKYIRDFPEGTLLVAELKLPEWEPLLAQFIVITFLNDCLAIRDTYMLKVDVTLSLAVLTAASRSKAEGSPSSAWEEAAYAFQSASRDVGFASRSLLGPPENQACAVLCISDRTVSIAAVGYRGRD